MLAGTASTRRRLHRRDVRPSILTLIDRLPLTAAFVMSAAYEVLAWNTLAAALMEDFGQVPQAERNLARKAFLGLPETTPIYGIVEDVEFRHGVVMQLRATLARYPDDPTIRHLIDDLVDGSDGFARLWARHDVQAAPMITKTFDNPVVGAVTVDCDSVLLPDRDQHLVLYSAPSDSPAAASLALLAVVGTQKIGAS